MKVLLTGFDPFGGEKINPAFEAVKHLPSNIKGHEIVKLEIPTVFGDSIRTVATAIEREQPDIVICVGQAGGTSVIKVERIAINLEEAEIEDNKGCRPDGSQIDAHGKNAYFATIPVKLIVEELLNNKIPAAVSYSAGTFVCNHVFYGLMQLLESTYSDTLGGFIHVPYLPEQVISKKNTPHMAQEMITQGLKIAITTACRE